MKTPYHVLSCVAVRSHAEDLVQLADILCGVVGWSWNAMKSASNAKPQFHQYVCNRLRTPTLANWETPQRAVPFNVWRYRPKKK